MIEVKNFYNWIEDKISGKFSSGASEKIWLINLETNLPTDNYEFAK